MNKIDDPSPELLLLLDAFMTEKAVMKATSLSRTSLHRKRLDGTFPRPEPISEGRVGYRIREIHNWLQDPQSWPSPKNTLDI